MKLEVAATRLAMADKDWLTAAPESLAISLED